jgi:hypothetical protein
MRQPTIQFAFRTTPHYANLIDRLATELNMSFTELVRESIEHYATTACPHVDPSLVSGLLMERAKVRAYSRRKARTARQMEQAP